MKATKILIPVFMILGLVSPLCAGQLLYEDFEGANAGDALVGNIAGWMGASDPGISSTLLDSGQSLDLCATTDSSWPVVQKTFSYVPDNGEQYVFSGTLLAPGTGGEYADPRLVASSDGSFVQAALGYGKLAFVMWEGGAGSMDNLRMEVNVPQLLTPMDFKVVLENNRTDCYWRSTGDAEWIHEGGVDFGLALTSYDTVTLVGHNVGSPYNGGMDSISLEAVSSALHPGDADGDGSVDVTDLGILATYYGQGSGHGWEQGDFTGDGLVNVNDLGILATNYGFTPTGVQAVPEPSSVALLFGLFVAVVISGRRSRLA